MGELIGWFHFRTAEEIFAVLIYNLRAKAVKCMNCDFICILANDIPQAFSHVDCPALGESEAKDARWKRVGFL